MKTMNIAESNDQKEAIINDMMKILVTLMSSGTLINVFHERGKKKKKVREKREMKLGKIMRV